MCSSHFLSHNQCLLARALASEYFDRQRFASDKRELHLREVLHTLLCPLAQIQSFGCLIRWRFLRQPTTMISASVSTLRVEEVPIDMVILPLVSKYRYFSPSRLWFFESRGVSTLQPASEHRLLLVFNAVSYGCNCNAYTFHEDDSVKRP